MTKPNSNQRPNRRKSNRKTIRSQVKVECRQSPFGVGNVLPAQLLNISEGGLCLALREGLAPKEVVELQILALSQTKAIVCLATVCWLVPLDNGDICVGLVFQNKLSLAEVLQISKQRTVDSAT